jgi:prolyl-tRNA editing enzyme YbaK/EbsC (Cys-tRNA(Pro) deacylase)
MTDALDWTRPGEHPDWLAEPTRTAVAALAEPERERVRVAEIDPELADTAAFCERYGMPLETSANCVVLAAKRGGEVSYAACLVLATQRADVNGVVRRHLGARKISFAPMEEAVGLTGMEYGGITPFGLPAGWPVLVDKAVVDTPSVVVGSGLRRSKLYVPGALVGGLPGAEVLALTKD